MNQHTVIIIPGIPAFASFLKILTAWFYLVGLTPVILDIHWTDTSESFIEKIKALLKHIDASSKHGKVSLLGLSAGGSAVVNAFCQRKNSIHKVVTICSRLAKENGVVSSNMKKYPAFGQAIELTEKNKLHLSLDDKRKIMTIRGIFDERMPSSLAYIDGAQQSTTFMVFHALIISFTLSFSSYPLISFLKKTTY